MEREVGKYCFITGELKPDQDGRYRKKIGDYEMNKII